MRGEVRIRRDKNSRPREREIAGATEEEEVQKSSPRARKSITWRVIDRLGEGQGRPRRTTKGREVRLAPVGKKALKWSA